MTQDDILILDAGSGIRELGKKLLEENFSGNISILISHYHWDHIQGIPFFAPLYQKGINITFYGASSADSSVKDFISYQMTPDHFPIKIDEFDCRY